MKYFTNSKPIIYVTTLLFALNAFGLSQLAKDGKILYVEADCMKCHGISPKYDPKNKKATDFEKVNSWVRLCDSQLETGWFPEEQESVAQYLNESFYKYKMK